MKPSFVALFAYMFSLGMGVIWEVFEFAVDQLLGMNTQVGSLMDTMSDLIVDGAGALVISVLGYGYLSTAGINSFLERWIHDFFRAGKPKGVLTRLRNTGDHCRNMLSIIRTG